MIEPVTLLATFITLWAQLHNYGIDVEGNEYLRNIRVRRDIYGLRNKDQIVQKDWRNSLILNSIYNGKEKRYKPYKLQDEVKQDKGQLMTILRAKRSSNYNENNNIQSSYIEGKVPLANYSTDSPYYSQNTDGVPYYYTSHNNIGNGYNNAGSVNNNIGNGYNNVGNVNNNIGNGNKLSNQHKTAVNNKQSQGHTSVISQHSNVNNLNNLASSKLNGITMQRMSQYVMPSNSLNQNNANNSYQYTQGTSVTSNVYQKGYNQGINYNSYPNGYTSQGINSGLRQFYNPFDGQTNSYNQTNGYTTPSINTNVYGINNAGNVHNNGINGYNNAGNWNNNVSNGNNNGRIWNYNTGFVNNNTRNGNYNSYRNNITGTWNNNLGSGNSTINWNFNGGAMNNNNNGNGYNNVGNGNTNVGNGHNNVGNGNNNTKVVQTSYFMSGVGCPQFFKSVSLFGSKVCLEDIDY